MKAHSKLYSLYKGGTLKCQCLSNESQLYVSFLHRL